MTRALRFLAVLLVACCAMTAGGSSVQAAQDWPTHPVTLIIPNGVGGEADTFGRLIAQKLSAVFGQNFIPENREGAGGIVGAKDVIRAQPDGYTLLVSSLGALVLANEIDQHGSLDPMKDFTHIAYFGGAPAVVFSNPTVLPAKNIKDLVSYVKANPGKLSFGIAAFGSSGHMAIVLLQREAHLDFSYVPYRGANDTVVSVLGGHIPVGASTLATASKEIAAGQLRALAVASPKRLSFFPNIPTFAEQGYPDIVVTNWFGLSGPANMPPDIVKRLNAAVLKILQSPDVRAALNNLSIEEPPPYDPAAFTAFVSRENARWTPVAQSIHINN